MSTAIVPNIIRDLWARELEDIFEEQYRLVYRTAYSLTGSVQDAEDILQTIFLRLLVSEIPPDLKQDPEPYLYRAAFNLSIDVIRARERYVLTGDLRSLDTRTAVTEANDMEEIDHRLHRAIGKLHPAAAQIVILRYVHNKRLADIAKIMGTSRSTVAVSLFRSRVRLKRLIEALPEGDA